MNTAFRCELKIQMDGKIVISTITYMFSRNSKFEISLVQKTIEKKDLHDIYRSNNCLVFGTRIHFCHTLFHLTSNYRMQYST